MIHELTPVMKRLVIIEGIQKLN